MKNKDNEKHNFFSMIKLIKDTPRYRALFILGLYLIFFTFIIVLTTPNNYESKTPIIKEEPVEVLEKYKDLSTYSFQHQITYLYENKLLNYNFNANKNKETIEFYDEDFQYTIVDNKLYQVIDKTKEEVDNNIILGSMEFTPKYIYSAIKNSKLESKTENYDNGTLTKQYRMELKNIDSIEFKDQISMVISTVEDDKKIMDVIINFEDSNMNKVEVNNIKEIKIKYLEVNY